MKTAYVEHLNSRDLWHRVYPRPISNPEEEMEEFHGDKEAKLSMHREDQLLYDWFRATYVQGEHFLLSVMN